MAIEERPLPFGARSVVYIVAALVALAALWASLAQVDRVVSARGRLITVDPLMVVQPLETGVIRTIDVSLGAFVTAGTVLATLDPTFTESEQVADRERLGSMAAEVRRLEAEMYGETFPPSPPDPSLDPKYVRLQAEIHEHRKAEYDASVAAASADIARFEASLATNRNGQSGLRQRLGVISEVESMRDELFKLSAGSRLNLLQSRLDRLTLSDQLDEKTNQEKELLEQLAAAREQKERTINNWIREVGERLTSVQQELAAATQKLTTAERRRNLVVLRAPADGVVLQLAELSIGSVAKEAEPIVTMVPRGSSIEAEVEVDGADIGRLRVGDKARLKLDALPFQRHGTLSGQLRIITENSFKRDKATSDQSDARTAFFRARIALDPPNLTDVPNDFRLIPGMTTTSEILVGKRTIVSYVLDPVIRLFDEGLRDP
jgi:HlyD family secretion protein